MKKKIGPCSFASALLFYNAIGSFEDVRELALVRSPLNFIFWNFIHKSYFQSRSKIQLRVVDLRDSETKEVRGLCRVRKTTDIMTVFVSMLLPHFAPIFFIRFLAFCAFSTTEPKKSPLKLNFWLQFQFFFSRNKRIMWILRVL